MEGSRCADKSRMGKSMWLLRIDVACLLTKGSGMSTTTQHFAAIMASTKLKLRVLGTGTKN